jgi:hypothetical protein
VVWAQGLADAGAQVVDVLASLAASARVLDSVQARKTDTRKPWCSRPFNLVPSPAEDLRAQHPGIDFTSYRNSSPPPRRPSRAFDNPLGPRQSTGFTATGMAHYDTSALDPATLPTNDRDLALFLCLHLPGLRVAAGQLSGSVVAHTADAWPRRSSLPARTAPGR